MCGAALDSHHASFMCLSETGCTWQHTAGDTPSRPCATAAPRQFQGVACSALHPRHKAAFQGGPMYLCRSQRGETTGEVTTRGRILGSGQVVTILVGQLGPVWLRAWPRTCTGPLGGLSFGSVRC